MPTTPRLADTEFVSRLHHELWPFHGHPNGVRVAQMGNIMQDLSNLAAEGVYIELATVLEYVNNHHPELSTGKDVEEYAKLVVKASNFYHKESREVGEALARGGKDESEGETVAISDSSISWPPTRVIVQLVCEAVVTVVCIVVLLLFILQ